MASRAVVAEVVLFMTRIGRPRKVTAVTIKAGIRGVSVPRRMTRNAVGRCMRTRQDKSRRRVIK